MIFETLQTSAERGELILVDGGMCHWHYRLDGQITIREIIVLPDRQRLGIGTKMLEILKSKQTGPVNIFAKCPVDLVANKWYKQKGFTLEKTEKTKTGRKLNHWRLNT